MAARKYSRIQEKGQVTVPADIRRKLGLKKGDVVTFEEKAGEVVMVPQQVVSIKDLGDISTILEEYGLTVEDLIESGREERGRILQERYGYDDSQING